MTTELIPNADMQVFPPADIARARLILNQPNLDEASAIKSLIIQRDTGLSMARGEISIVPFNGRPTVMINKQGYLAYASRQEEYDGYESGVETVDGEVIAWCKVYNKNRSHPVSVKIYQKEYAKSTPIWREKPRYMLEKTAISLALRAAFPILNGTYTEDEIEADAPVRIQPKPSDIKVSPEPVTVKEEVKQYVPAIDTGMSAKQEPIKTISTYPAFQAKSLMENYRSHGYGMDVFSKALLPNGDYDKEMIDADYKRQMMAENTSDPSPKQAKPESHGEDGLQKYTAEVIQEAEHKRTIDQPWCIDCGNTRVLPNEEKESRARYGVAICPKCMEKRLAADMKAKLEAQALEDAGKESVKNLVAAAKKAGESKQTKPSADSAKNVDDGCCTVCGKKMSKGEISEWTMFNKGQPLKCKECGNKKQTAET